jgi:hypothetical protein
MKCMKFTEARSTRILHQIKGGAAGDGVCGKARIAVENRYRSRIQCSSWRPFGVSRTTPFGEHGKILGAVAKLSPIEQRGETSLQGDLGPLVDGEMGSVGKVLLRKTCVELITEPLTHCYCGCRDDDSQPMKRIRLRNFLRSLSYHIQHHHSP